jgi:hypothetical protein
LTLICPFGTSSGRKSSVSTFRASVASSKSFGSSFRCRTFCEATYACAATPPAAPDEGASAVRRHVATARAGLRVEEIGERSSQRHAL